YHEMGVWQSLYERWIATGKCKGIWQTEIGFCPFPNYYPNAYLRGLYWALTHQWDEPDKYKLFWYALWGAGPNAKSCLSTGGQERVLTAHGQRAAAMTQLLGGSTLEAFTQFRLDYPLPFQLNEDKPAAMGFRAGRDTVLAFILDEAAQAKHPAIGVTLPNRSHRPATVEWADVEGNLHPLTFEYTNGMLRIQFPAEKLDAAVARDYGHAVRFAIGYLRVRD
ncbi:MAG TPA: hypothetical protein VHR86_10515, partial [Armatimonadota bacterium]|nr:hypothetical protein [Armatimonadota bacterium]